ncbi:MAG TPA: lactate utilization protein C [Burkholderiales bacterium]|nr:lactate utilization protein C [Burkholderiales bacterium]
MSARENTLARIRAALGKSADRAQREEIRAYIRQHAAGPRPEAEWNVVMRFRERALNSASSVDQVTSISEVPGAIARYLREQHLPLQAVCWPEFARLDWHGQEMTVEVRPANGSDLVGITGAFCAIAETGTLMTLSGKDTPPATSLLPETHIAVVGVTRIVKGMEEAWALLRNECPMMPRAVNFISGPSRTADIEQTIVLGAHGPYRVHIVIIQR